MADQTKRSHLCVAIDRAMRWVFVALKKNKNPLPQSALKSKTPMPTMKEWHHSHPHLFKRRPYDCTGCDSREGQSRTC